MQQLKGIPASRGKATGIARIILNLKQIKDFKPGDILVTESTNPSWTPIIYAASAVVTEVGGSLSHAAIVSREYGKPAVVGIKEAIKKIKDGQKITVDGTKGIISIN